MSSSSRISNGAFLTAHVLANLNYKFLESEIFIFFSAKITISTAFVKTRRQSFQGSVSFAFSYRPEKKMKIKMFWEKRDIFRKDTKNCRFCSVSASLRRLCHPWSVLASSGWSFFAGVWPIFISSCRFRRFRPFSAGLTSFSWPLPVLADFGRPWLVNFSPGRIQPVLTGLGQSSWPWPRSILTVQNWNLNSCALDIERIKSPDRLLLERAPGALSLSPNTKSTWQALIRCWFRALENLKLEKDERVKRVLNCAINSAQR